MFALKLFFAGLWPLVWHWGTPAAIIILCLVAEIAIGWFAASVPFVEKWLKPLQKDILYVAAAAGFFLFAFADGVKVEHARNVAQQAALLQQIDRVVDQVTNDPANKPDTKPLKKGQKRTPPKDRWDRPEN